MIPRASRNSVIATAAGGEAFDVSVGGHTIRTDQPVAAGGGGTGPSPLTLLSAAMAGCVALYVHRFCVQRGVDGKGIAVEVNPLWKPDPGRIARFDVVLHLPASVPAHARPVLEAVARSCPVHRTLLGTPEITVTTLAPPARGQGVAEAELTSCGVSG